MIASSNIGRYLGREMILGVLHHSLETVDLYLADATVLLLFARVYDAKLDNHLLSALLQKHPLALVVTGAGARKAFDALIDLVSTPEPGPHVMTGIFDTTNVEDAVAEFLHSSWPAEERFDTWKKLMVLIVGPDEDEVVIRASHVLQHSQD